MKPRLSKKSPFTVGKKIGSSTVRLGKLPFSIRLSPLSSLIIGAIMGICYVGVELYQDLHPILPSPKEMQVCFTPGQTCQKLILTQINNAKHTIHVQAFSFTDPDIGTALVNAHKRGVTVQVILDKSNKTNKKSVNRLLTRHQIPVKIDEPTGIAHSKIIIIDEQKVITGSYNFSTGAYKRNTENVLVMHDAAIAKQYLENWKSRWKKSRFL